MKKFLAFSSLAYALTISATAQHIEINKSLLLNGAAASDRRIINLGPPLQNTDATNAQVVQSGLLNFAVATGATNTFELSLSPAPISYTAGMVVYFKTNNAVTGPATINVNGLGSRSLYKQGNTPLGTADISASQIVCAVYDGNSFQLSAASPVTILSPEQFGYDQFKYHVAPPIGTWTVPAGVTQIMVEVWGGGGGSGHYGCDNACGNNTGNGEHGGSGGSGGAGSYGREILSVTPGTSYIVAVGAAGTTPNGSYSACGTAGGNGGTSSFGNLVIATGGQGGQAGRPISVCSGTTNATFAGGAGGLGGSSNATVNYTGQTGSTGPAGFYDGSTYRVYGGLSNGGTNSFTSIISPPATPSYLQDYIQPFRAFHTLKPAPGGPGYPGRGGFPLPTDSSMSGYVLISY